MSRKSLPFCLILGSFGVVTAAAAQSSNTLSVMSFGGAFQAAQRSTFFEPYTKQSGVKIVEQEYGGEAAKIKAMVDSGNTTIDVIDVDAPTATQGCDEGLFETLDWAKIGNQSDWIPGTTNECAVGTTLSATIVAYDSARITSAPTKMADIFDTAKFPGKRGLWKNPFGNMEFALMADGVPVADVYKVLATPAGVDRAFKKLDTIKKDVVWWETGAQAPALLASGEVLMTTAWNGRIFNANKEGKQFKIIWDHEMLAADYWVIPKGAHNTKDAINFIAFSVKPDVLANFAKLIPYGPANKLANADVSPDIAANLPTTPANMGNSFTVDNKFWADHADEIRKRFTTWLAQ